MAPPAANTQGGHKMRIAVLTSGGDSAGMNSAVRTIVKAGILKGCETYVVREGYEGLVRGNSTPAPATPAPARSTEAEHLADDAFVHNLRFGDGELLRHGEGDASDDPDGHTLKGRYIIRVGWDDVRGWLAEGGTLIGTARSAAFRTPEGRLSAALNMVKEGIDALCVCGGDGSLTGADVFRAEWSSLIKQLLEKGSITKEQFDHHQHLKIVGLVGSIDNDMSMTDLTIGALTALHRICEAIDNINSTAISHSRAFVIEVMGRHCGWLALMAGISGGADFVFIPERPPMADPWEDEMCEVIQGHRAVGKRKTIVIVAEGAHDASMKPIAVDYVKSVLSERLGLDTRVTTLGHTQRGGKPCAFDRILPMLQGVEAVDALLEATPETPSYMIGIQENKITRIPLLEAVKQTHAIAKAVEAKDYEKAMSLRDPEFAESLESFYTSSISLDSKRRLPEDKRLRIGIIHVGAPAGGMNAATRTAVRYCISHGHTPLAVYNGFKGLLDDNVQPLSWLRVDSWMARGGSELGTNRTLPDVDIGSVASKFQQYHFDAFFLIGGFEAFTALVQLEQGRQYYPAFRIPMVHLPATISNNVPVTEFSLGSDTSLNSLVNACDVLRQSASASRNRVFVVETQGGKCGYIATMGALATGAVLVYTPEVGINLDLLRDDVQFLKTRYLLDVKGRAEGRLVLRNEQASNIFTTDVITKILKEEGGSLFDSRSASLGHILQGDVPSPLDRARAVRLSMKCMSFLEREALAARAAPALQRRTSVAVSPKSTAAVITIQGSNVVMVPVHEMQEHADMNNRRNLNSWWEGYKELAELLGGRTALVAQKKC
ncbi:6-phosphofructokinase [Exidia glandulosa HHB12029]|uniref:ATP-dependent 6-phosphofructokinase n=1 Tax=Exidia glandulosa HHB12029 TaxID=1314781 RepID=A0A165PYR3_EXIGL|nr:6-phosphofructokinase [Exidia glandulosa HHB12029]